MSRPSTWSGKAEFLRRAHHALAGDAENFSFLDDERFFIARLQRQREIGQDQRDFVARLVILRAANDGAFAFAVVDFADGEFVRARHFVFGEDLRDDDALEFAGDFVDAFDFECRAWSAAPTVARATNRNHVLFQPIKSDFHAINSFSASYD